MIIFCSTNTGPLNGSTLSRDESGSGIYSDCSEEKGLLRSAERKRSVTAAQGRLLEFGTDSNFRRIM